MALLLPIMDEALRFALAYADVLAMVEVDTERRVHVERVTVDSVSLTANAAAAWATACSAPAVTSGGLCVID